MVVTWEVQNEYINQLAIILGPHIDKLPQKIIIKIAALLRDIGVNIKPADNHAP